MAPLLALPVDVLNAYWLAGNWVGGILTIFALVFAVIACVESPNKRVQVVSWLFSISILCAEVASIVLFINLPRG